MNTRKRYSPEFRERAVRLVEEQQKEGSSEWKAIHSLSEKLGCVPETLRRWVRQSQRDQGKRPGQKILRKASAYFAQAELDRRPK
jgi:transposase